MILFCFYAVVKFQQMVTFGYVGGGAVRAFPLLQPHSFTRSHVGPAHFRNSNNKRDQ